MSRSNPISICYNTYSPEEDSKGKEDLLVKESTPEEQFLEAAEHQKHIEQLAKPKKPFPGGPIRLNQKQKTIAFGRTVNVSQCIEGRPLKNNNTRREISKPLGRQMVNNHSREEKENVPEVNKEKSAMISRPKITEEKRNDTEDIVLKIEQLLERKLEKFQKENDHKFNELESKINNKSLVPSRGTEITREEHRRGRLSESEYRLLREIENAFKENPYFIEHTVNLCKQYIPQIRNYQTSDNHSEDSQRDHSKNFRNKKQEERRSNPTVTERITLERSYQSDYPYSVDTATFLANRTAPNTPREYGKQSTYREGTGISIQSPSICHNRYNSPPPAEPPKSQYKPVNSVTFAAHSTVYEEDFSDVEEHNISEPEFNDEDCGYDRRDSDSSSVHDLTQRQAERKARFGHR